MTSDDTGELPDYEQRLLAFVGRELAARTPGPDPVNEPMIRHWTAAMGDTNPVYTDAAAARATGRADVVAPASMCQAWTMRGYGTATDDGRRGFDELVALLDEGGYTSVVATDSDFEFLRELAPGDRIAVRETVESISTQKRTGLGTGRFVTTVKTYTDQDERTVATQRWRTLRFRPAGAGVAGTGGAGVADAGGAGVAGTGGPEMAGTAGAGVAGSAGIGMADIVGAGVAGTGGPEMAGTAGAGVADTGGPEMAGTAGAEMAGTAGAETTGSAGIEVAGSAGIGMAVTGGSEATGTAGAGVADTGGPEATGTAGAEMADTGGPEMADTAGAEMADTAGAETTDTAGTETTDTAGTGVAVTGGPETTGTAGPETADTRAPQSADTAGTAPKAPRPRPAVNRDNAFWFEGAREHRLLIQRCAACEVLRHPPGPCCPACGSLEWDTVESVGRGEVYSFVVNHHPRHPAFDFPHVVAVVALDEGTRLIANLTGVTPEDVTVGMRVVLDWFDADPDLTLPVFRPAEAEAN
ncbi:MaoC family dehydratase N-terminal domain-containing protein [Streptomyces sp. NPDC002795]|uniref:FAS1-like dehydratase domain-containing protein n=1 Tax=Streptomyces sp. NPDC002795 TaxID=3364665 RepID=UPI00369570E7